MMFDAKNNTFTRTGSFRQQSLTERLEKERGIDVGSTKSAPVNPFAIERPHATPSMLQRQGSCRGFSVLGENSPFKRQMSLRVNELPSNTARLNSYKSPTSPPNATKPPVSPIPEVSPGDSVIALCHQLSQGLSQLTHSGSDDLNFNNQSSVNQNHSSVGSLPQPEQWLELVNTSSPTPKRTPSLRAHARAVSLDAGSGGKGDPFDAEWAERAAAQTNNSTNPFLTSGVAAQAFQIQL